MRQATMRQPQLAGSLRACCSMAVQVLRSSHLPQHETNGQCRRQRDRAAGMNVRASTGSLSRYGLQRESAARPAPLGLKLSCADTASHCPPLLGRWPNDVSSSLSHLAGYIGWGRIHVTMTMTMIGGCSSSSSDQVSDHGPGPQHHSCQLTVLTPQQQPSAESAAAEGTGQVNAQNAQLNRG